jgi:hypothetical protein
MRLVKDIGTRLRSNHLIADPETLERDIGFHKNIQLVNTGDIPRN